MSGLPKKFELRESGKNRITETSLRRGSSSEQGRQLANMMIENTRLASQGAVDQYFKEQLISHLNEKGMFTSLSDIISSFDRHTSINYVQKAGEKIFGRKKGIRFAIAFAVARGKAIIEKSKQALYVDTNQQFKSRYDLEIEELNNGDYKVCIKVKGSKKASYTHNINPSKMTLQVIGEGVNRDHDTTIVLGETKALPYSEILWHAYNATKLRAGIPVEEFNYPTDILHTNITNQETAQTSSLFSSMKFKFKKGSDGFYAMLGTPNCCGMVYYLEQHKKDLEDKEITEIEGERGYLGSIRMLIGDKTSSELPSSASNTHSGWQRQSPGDPFLR